MYQPKNITFGTQYNIPLWKNYFQVQNFSQFLIISDYWKHLMCFWEPWWSISSPLRVGVSNIDTLTWFPGQRFSCLKGKLPVVTVESGWNWVESTITWCNRYFSPSSTTAYRKYDNSTTLNKVAPFCTISGTTFNKNAPRTLNQYMDVIANTTYNTLDYLPNKRSQGHYITAKLSFEKLNKREHSTPW